MKMFFVELATPVQEIAREAFVIRTKTWLCSGAISLAAEILRMFGTVALVGWIMETSR
jgi:hypothetical protein